MTEQFNKHNVNKQQALPGIMLIFNNSTVLTYYKNLQFNGVISGDENSWILYSAF